jgi:hypothetical protein
LNLGRTGQTVLAFLVTSAAAAPLIAVGVAEGGQGWTATTAVTVDGGEVASFAPPQPEPEPANVVGEPAPAVTAEPSLDVVGPADEVEQVVPPVSTPPSLDPDPPAGDSGDGPGEPPAAEPSEDPAEPVLP